MDSKHSRRVRATAASRVLALLLLVCLLECAAEQRINRGSKPSILVEKINGYRSQRGGSCLSYGHSCWGAHGKRSGKLPATAPDWYLTRILRRMAASAEMKHAQQPDSNNEDLSAIFRVDDADSSSGSKLTVRNSDMQYRDPQAKPMLDDDMLYKMKLWQMMRDSSEDK